MPAGAPRTAPAGRGKLLLRVIARAILLAVIVAILVWIVDFRALIAAMARVSVVLFAACVALDLVLIVIDSWRIEALSGFRYRFGPVFRARLISLLVGNALPGTAGSEVVRFVVLNRQQPGRPMALALLLLANRLYGLLGLPALFLVAAFGFAGGLPDSLGLSRVVLAAVASIALALPLAFAVRPVRRVAAGAVIAFHGRTGRLARRVYCALRSFSSPRPWLLATSSSVLASFVSLLQMWLLGAGLGAQATLAEWAIIVPTVALASFVPAGVGAVGPQDAALASVACILGRPIEPFLAVSIVLHGVRLVTSAGGVLFVGELKRVVGSISLGALPAMLRRARAEDRRA